MKRLINAFKSLAAGLVRVFNALVSYFSKKKEKCAITSTTGKLFKDDVDDVNLIAIANNPDWIRIKKDICGDKVYIFPLWFYERKSADMNKPNTEPLNSIVVEETYLPKVM